MDEILELECNVMELHIGAGEEIHRMMIGIAPHEAEEIADPIGDAKAQHLFIEADGALDIGREEGDMTELERTDAGHLLVLAEIAPVLEQLDGGSLVVGKREHLTDAGHGIIAQLAPNAVFRKLLCKIAEIRIWRDFKRKLDTVAPVRLVQRNHQLPDLG